MEEEQEEEAAGRVVLDSEIQPVKRPCGHQLTHDSQKEGAEAGSAVKEESGGWSGWQGLNTKFSRSE